jgi:TP901 family phage tail tape measure protein
MADGTIKIDTRIDQKGINQGIKDMQKNLNGAADKLKGAGKKMSAAVTAPIVGLGTVAFAAADQMDKAYREIQVGSGATGDALEDLKQSFDNVFVGVPDTADQVAGALSNLNTYTGATGEVLEGLTQSVLDASRTLGEDGVANADAFGKAMQQWQIPAEDGTAQLDHLYKLTQDYNVGLGEISGALTTYGAVLGNAGFEMAESAEFMARLESNGISVSRIMPGLNSAFRKWADEGKNSREELEKVVTQIRETEDSQEALSLATETFGAEGAQRLMTAIRNGAIPAFDELGSSMEDSQGLIQDTTEETRTIGERFGILKNEAMNGLQPLGEILIELAENALTPLMDGVKRVAEWFQNLSPAMQNTIVVVGGLLAAIGPLLLVVGGLISAFTTVMPVIAAVGKAFMLLMNPIPMIIAGVVALGLIIYDNWEWIKETTITVFTAIGEFLSESWTWIKETATELWTSISEFFIETWTFIRETFTEALIAIQEWITEKWTEAQETTTEVFTAISDFFSGIWETIKSTVSGAINGVKDTISNVWNTIKDTTSNIWNGVKDTLSGIWEGLKSGVSEAFNTIKDTISGVWDGVKSSTDDIWDGITGSVKGAINGVIGAINGMIDALNGLSINLPTIPDWVPGLGGSGGGEISFPNIPRIPSLDVGTNFVARDGLAFLHQGEAVVPKEYNPAAGGTGGATNMTVIAQLDGEEIARVTKPHIDTSMSDDITLEAFLRGER